MIDCIHCNGPGVRAIAKRWSCREAPATCSLCGKHAYVVASTGSWIPVATLLMLVASAVLGAFAGHPLWGALCGVPFAVAYNIRAWKKAEMSPISPEAAASARKVFWLVELLMLLGVLAR